MNSPWYDEFNKYDLLAFISVPVDFPQLVDLQFDLRACTKFLPTDGEKRKAITFAKFLAEIVIVFHNRSFSLNDLLASVAYNRGLHNAPDDIGRAELYSDFIERYSQTAFQMLLDIGTCFVRGFEPVYEKFVGDNNAFCDEYSSQPKIEIDSKTNEPYFLFSNSYMQSPIREMKHHGVRICLRIRLVRINDSALHFIFSSGHRGKSNLRLFCSHENAGILIRVEGAHLKRPMALRLPVTDMMFESFFWLEVALYPNGNLALGIDQKLSRLINTPARFSLSDGKLVVGADLDGQNHATFHENASMVEAIDLRNRTYAVARYALRRIHAFASKDLPAELLDRPVQY